MRFFQSRDPWDREYLCDACGCVVVGKEAHREFHESLVNLIGQVIESQSMRDKDIVEAFERRDDVTRKIVQFMSTGH